MHFINEFYYKFIWVWLIHSEHFKSLLRILIVRMWIAISSGHLYDIINIKNNWYQHTQLEKRNGFQVHLFRNVKSMQMICMEAGTFFLLKKNVAIICMIQCINTTNKNYSILCIAYAASAPFIFWWKKICPPPYIHLHLYI